MAARPLIIVALVVVALVVAWIPSCRSFPPGCVALMNRVPNGTGEGWSDDELRSFARDAWAYSESQSDRWVKWNLLLWVELASRRGASVEVSGEVLDQTLRRFADAAEGDRDPWTFLLIPLGQLWRAGQDARTEADQKLSLLQRIEDSAPTPLVSAIVPNRKVSLFMDLDSRDLLRDPEEREEAMRQIDVMAERKDDLDTYWNSSTTSMLPRATARLKATRLGAIAPPLTGTTLSGTDFDLTSTRGTVTLVRFWGFW